jgi:uncharacterized SCP-like protein
VPARRPDPQRLLAALVDQRAELGLGPWSGEGTIESIGAACADAVLAAMDARLEPVPSALRGAVIYTLDLMSSIAPGPSVELRVPPFGVVQCVPGPRHTRGTPPNVVETDARTWLLLAAGRLSWASAKQGGALRASGPRSDLASYLPIWTPRPPG